MKLMFSLFFVIGSLYCGHSQDLDKNYYSFSDVVFKSESSSFFSVMNYKHLSLSNFDFTNFKLNPRELNEKLFTDLKPFENTFRDHKEYLRGCRPLENGISNTVNSSDLMLSLVIDNFVNNVLFEGRGPLTRLFYPNN